MLVKTGRFLRPLAPKTLLAQTPANVVGFARGCDANTVHDGDDWQAPSQYRNLASLGPVFRQFFTVQCTAKYEDKAPRTGDPKTVVLCWAGKPVPGLKPDERTPGRPSMDTPVWVSCPCQHFRYVCEWALSRYGSSDIIHSTGEPAHETNPRGTGMLCKHAYLAIQQAIRDWHGKAPADKAVEEPAVDDVPAVPAVPARQVRTPVAPPKKKQAPAVKPPASRTQRTAPVPQQRKIQEEQQQQEDQEEPLVLDLGTDDEEVKPAKRASLMAIAQAIRSIAYPCDTECC